MADLPWFLFLPGGTVVRSRLAVQVDFGIGGPRSAHFDIAEPGLRDPPSLLAALAGGPENRLTRSLNAFATAERARRWFHEALGWPQNDLRWTLGRRVLLEPHVHRSVHDRRGKYFSSSGTIELDYLRSPDGSERSFACLSHDIVVHEVMHALLEASNDWRDLQDDTRAVSESLADVLALFSVSRIQAARDAAREESPDLRESNILIRFGEIPGEAQPVRDASAAPADLDQVDADDPYEVAAVLTAALCDALADRLEQLELEGAAGDPLEAAILELSRAAFAAILRLPRGTVRVAQAATEIRAQASPQLAEHLAAAYARRRIPSTPTAEEEALLAEVAGASDPVAAIAGMLGAITSSLEVREVATRRRVRFPLARETLFDVCWEGRDRQGTATLAFGADGRCHSCHLTFAT